MNIEELMMPIDEWNKQFSCKHIQQPISFLTEENLDRLQQHCEKTVQYGNGRILEEHQVTLELIIRYQNLKQELEKEKEKNKELTERVLKLESDKFWDNVVSKSKIKQIIYPTPENEIPIEIQQSEMYKKLVKEVEE